VRWEEQVGGIDKVTIDAFTEESDKIIKADVNKFYSENLDLIQKFIDETDTDYSQVGHSLWLTRQLFGAGFADFKGNASQKLHEKALKMGDVSVEYGDDGKIHVYGRGVTSAKLPSFKVTFENGDTLVTSMATGITLEDAKKYYIGRSFTFGTGEEGNPERQVKAVDVEQIGFESEASKSVPKLSKKLNRLTVKYLLM
jgi:hypothetical protein